MLAFCVQTRLLILCAAYFEEHRSGIYVDGSLRMRLPNRLSIVEVARLFGEQEDHFVCRRGAVGDAFRHGVRLGPHDSGAQEP